jgi:carbon monoxide dehydrogenase subunit G
VIIEGKFTLKVPIQEAWDKLLNPETLASCIPGCEKIEVIDEKTYDCVVKQKVGPVSVRLKFTTTLIEIDPPTHLKAIGKGADIGKAGNFNQQTTVDLREVSAGEVEVSYMSNVTIVGRLATFGDRIMRAKAKDLEKQFTQALQENLKGGKS